MELENGFWCNGTTIFGLMNKYYFKTQRLRSWKLFPFWQWREKQQLRIVTTIAWEFNKMFRLLMHAKRYGIWTHSYPIKMQFLRGIFQVHDANYMLSLEIFMQQKRISNSTSNRWKNLRSKMLNSRDDGENLKHRYWFLTLHR